MIAAPLTERDDSVSTLLGQDHIRLDALLNDALEARDAGRVDLATPRFLEFKQGLERHIRIEDEILFPAFEQATGMPEGPTSVMRREHGEILDKLESIATTLLAGAGSGLRAWAPTLQALLGDHNAKEEGILYPMTDRVLSVAARADLVRRLREA